MKLKYLRDPIQTIIYFKYTWISSSLIFVVYIYSSSQNCGFSSSLLWMWELDYKESWAPKNWCFWTVVLENILESPLDCKIKPVNPKGNNPEYSLEYWTDAEAKAPILWPPMWRTDSLEKPLMLGKIEGKRKRGQQRMRWLDGIIAPTHVHWVKLWEIVKDRKGWCAAIHGVTKSRTRMRD